MRDRDWGGDWVTGEFKTASLTGSNFAGIVDAARCRTKGDLRRRGRSATSRAQLKMVSTVEWSSRVEDVLLSVVVVADGGGGNGGVEGQKEGGST